MSGYTLYGAEVSYFTGKARAYLDWRGVEYEEKVASRDVYKNIIMPNVGWSVIPVMTTASGDVVQDTADIIARVEADSHSQPSAIPDTPLQKFAAQLFQLYGDEWLVIPAMHYRWTYNEDWAYGEFGALSAPGLTADEHYQIGKANGARFKGALPVLGVSKATIPGIEKSYEAFLAEFSAHLERYPYVLGDQPTLADFSLYGPLYAHLYRDPTSGELMKRLAPEVAEWVLRLKTGSKDSGVILADDAIPETLLPILTRQMQEQIPMLQATAAMFDVWAAEAASGEVVPRALGDLEISIEGCSGPARARSFSLYRLQDVTDAYDAMSDSDKTRADNLLDKTGGSLLKTLRLSKRLKRETYRVVLA